MRIIIIRNFIDTSSDSIIRDMDRCKKIFQRFDIEASDRDCEVIRRVCVAVSTRAARLAAAGIVALVEKIGKSDGCTVAVDASLYEQHSQFPERYYNSGLDLGQSPLPPPSWKEILNSALQLFSVRIYVHLIIDVLLTCTNYSIQVALDELAPGSNIKIKTIQDGSSRGAALAAAMSLWYCTVLYHPWVLFRDQNYDESQ
jgi:hexokinase